MSVNIHVVISDELHRKLTSRKGRESMANFLPRFLDEALGKQDKPDKALPVNDKEESSATGGEEEIPSADTQEIKPEPSLVRSSSVRAFVSAWATGKVPVPLVSVPDEDLYDVYAIWCGRNGLGALGSAILFKKHIALSRDLDKASIPGPFAGSSPEGENQLREFREAAEKYRQLSLGKSLLD